MSGGWHILGAGAIGGLFARRLLTAGIDTTLLVRNAGESRRTLSYEQGGVSTSTTFRCEGPTHPGAISCLLICTKSHSVIPGLRSLQTRLSETTQIVLLVNGMGIAEQVRDLLPDNPVVLGSTTAACYRDPEDTWHPIAEGDTFLGASSPQETATPAWFTDWSRGVPGLVWEPNIHARLLDKLAINAVINPATALLNISNGALLLPEYAELLNQACAETAAVLTAVGKSSLAKHVVERVTAVATTTANNTSSMRADVLAGRQTETEAILGYLLETLKPEAVGPPATPLLDHWLARLRAHDAACAN